MNADLLLPFGHGELPACPPLEDLVSVQRSSDQAPRLIKRTITPNQQAGGSAGVVYHPEKFILVKKSSSSALLSSSNPDFPSSPTSVFQEVDLLQQQEEEAAEERAALQSASAIAIQAIIRGTLARWNLPVLKLQRKLESIQALKEKQIKKIQQRKVQKMRSDRAEHEYREEHRIVRRRLRRAKCVRSQYAQEKVLVLEENHQLRAECQQLAQQNDESARILSSYIQSMEIAQQNLNASKSTMIHLEDTCRTYQTILHVFREVTMAEEAAAFSSSSSSAAPEPSSLAS